MNLATTYLGLRLPHPFMPGASPLVDDLDTVRRLEDSGAAAIVMHSLFEEQLVTEQVATHAALELPAESFAEAMSYLPSPADLTLGPEQYLEQLLRIKHAVEVPVIASLNGVTAGGWLEYAALIQQAGADALELNVYRLATDPERSAESLERELVEMVRALKASMKIPLAVKLSPFYTSLVHLVRRLSAAGADGLVLFNRFYQPDLDLEQLDVARTLRLSDSSELLLRLRWLAILRGQVEASLASSGGVHTPLDALKAIMAGADAVQVVSLLLRRGPEALAELHDGVIRWLEEHEYQSLDQARGSLSLERCPDPSAYERANYVHILDSWRGLS
ncbi:MAG: dihydroorotate dehydrogenase-like protein [Holophagales bacterium]|nr:dihydroorotate dehydrogenase-like protein [Holophagales bacterium]